MNLTLAKRLVSLATRSRPFRRSFSSEFANATFYASTEGGLKYLKPRVESIDPLLTRFARDYVVPGNSVWDIGANVGLFAFAASGRAGSGGSVTAFEPDPWLASLLRRSSTLNRSLARVDVICSAVSATTGLLKFQIANQSRACNALEGYGNSTMAGVREEIVVPSLRLDEALKFCRPPDVLKIDTEGAEIVVLQGAENILTIVRPLILAEVNESNAEVFADLLTNYNYIFIDAESRAPIQVPTFNTICVPLAKSACGIMDLTASERPRTRQFSANQHHASPVQILGARD